MVSDPSGDGAWLLDAFDRAIPVARRLVRTVRDEDVAWTPHPRALDLGRLAAHVIDIPRWIPGMLQSDGYDVRASRPSSASWPGAASACATFDAHVAAGRARLADASPGTLAAPWRLRRGPDLIRQVTRAQAVHLFIVNHVAHHAGQLHLYLVLLGALPPGDPE